ncbi:hypothetical protein O9G_004628 [Rozella allomycis CSF55]|uniref:Uncharacterized protein n=1 Tax=Rozella allomycis (strain CSF55) TaxID=988480 RepID=A0A075AUU7_ROZAC|nr:hypothetical protein O9G_004628 [Rozella allomycis CSF55]|eukprot:EPZ34028.1 hypothetical protein O9G_004628 [Rozella allomycis CSF55]
MDDKHFQILSKLLSNIHQKEENGLSLKFTEETEDLNLFNSDPLLYPSSFNVARFEITPTEKYSSEDELINYVFEDCELNDLEKNLIIESFHEIMNNLKLIQVFLKSIGFRLFYGASITYARLNISMKMTFSLQVRIDCLLPKYSSFNEFTSAFDLEVFKKQDVVRFLDVVGDPGILKNHLINGLLCAFDRDFSTIERKEQGNVTNKYLLMIRKPPVKQFRVAQLPLKEKSNEGLPINFEKSKRLSELAKKSEESMKRAFGPPRQEPKATAAAILREEAEEEKQIREAEIGLRNAKLIERLELAMRNEEELQRQVELERKRLEILLIREDAVISKQQSIESRRAIADDVRQEQAEIREKIVELKKQEMEINANKVLLAQTIQENAKNAVSRVIAEKKEIANEEAKRELEKKIKLIKRIRALEQVALENRKQSEEECKVDFTETSGYGVLNEMSIVEVRLLLTGEIVARKVGEEKRQKIINERTEKSSEMNRKVEAIKKFRGMEQEKRQERLEKGYEYFVGDRGLGLCILEKRMIRDPKMQELQIKLNEKRQGIA